MSKLKRAQSKTGKTGIKSGIIEILEKRTGKVEFIEREKDDKAKVDGLRVDRGSDTPKKGRKAGKGYHLTAKGRKRPDSDSGK